MICNHLINLPHHEKVELIDNDGFKIKSPGPGPGPHFPGWGWDNPKLHVGLSILGKKIHVAMIIWVMIEQHGRVHPPSIWINITGTPSREVTVFNGRMSQVVGSGPIEHPEQSTKIPKAHFRLLKWTVIRRNDYISPVQIYFNNVPLVSLIF